MSQPLHVLVVVILCCVAPVAAKILYHEKFDDLKKWDIDIDGKTGHVDLQNNELSTNVTYCGGGKCYRAELKIKDKYRKDLMSSTEGEYWFGFTSRIPSSWDYYGGDHKSYNFQIHGGDNIGRPPIIGLRNEGDKMTVNICGVKKERDKDPDCDTHKIGSVKPGEWDHWVIYDKLKYSSHSGEVRIWRNGKEVLHVEGALTSYNDKSVPYAKIGSYETDWKYDQGESVKTDSAAVEYKEMKFGDKHSSYDEVYTM